ncbi:hypothetical protein RRG08_063068, partial [Elysia crispata]
KIKFLRFQSSFKNNRGFLVAGEDTSVIEFEVSGNNSVHAFIGKNGPQFYYTTTDGVSHKGCMGFDPDTGSCTNRKGVRDACSCEIQTSNIYRLSYTKTATLDTNRGSVYFLWPGKPNLRSDNYTFPEIKAKTTGILTKILIGAGVVALLAIFAGVGVICYNKYSGSERVEDEINNPTQSSSPAAVKTQVGMEIEEETEDNRADAGYETNNLENSV